MFINNTNVDFWGGGPNDSYDEDHSEHVSVVEDEEDEQTPRDTK